MHIILQFHRNQSRISNRYSPRAVTLRTACQAYITFQHTTSAIRLCMAKCTNYKHTTHPQSTSFAHGIRLPFIYIDSRPVCIFFINIEHHLVRIPYLILSLCVWAARCLCERDIQLRGVNGGTWLDWRNLDGIFIVGKIIWRSGVSTLFGLCAFCE